MRLVAAATILAVSGCNDVGFSTLENTPPEVSIVSHRDGDAVLEGYAFEISGAVLDNGGVEDVQLAWYANDLLVCAEPAEVLGRTSCVIVPELEDSLRIRLEGTDVQGAVGSVFVDLVVNPSLPPTADITRPLATARYYSNTPVPLEGLLSDAEDDAQSLQYSWTSDAAGPLPVTGAPDVSGAITGSALLEAGPHQITLTVTDGAGKTGFDSVSIEVGPPNNPPTCELLAPPDGASSGQWNEVIFVGLAQDPDVGADQLLVAFESDLDGLLATVTPSVNGDVQLAWSALQLGDHAITMTVTDDAGATCVDQVVHTVVEPPSAPVADVVPDVPQSVDNLVCEIALASVDPQGDPLTYVFEWTQDAVLYTGPTLTTTWPGDTVLNTSTGPGQVWECAARATDGLTTGAPGTDSVTIAIPGVTHAVAGKNHSCLIDTNTWLECWGDLNNNLQDLEGGLYDDIGLGANHTCGIDLGGSIDCVGINSVGQTDTGGLVGSFVQIDAGDQHTCAIDTTDGVQCWGNDVNGESDTSALTGSYLQVTAGFQHSCAITTGNDAVCWGSDAYGRATPPAGVSFVQISAGKDHTCGIDLAGDPQCFGRNTNGQTFPPANVTFAVVSAGDGVSCGVAGSPGPILCWGAETDPALGGINVPPAGNFWSVYAGDGHQCAVDELYGVQCWGDNAFGEATAPTIWW